MHGLSSVSHFDMQTAFGDVPLQTLPAPQSKYQHDFPSCVTGLCDNLVRDKLKPPEGYESKN